MFCVAWEECGLGATLDDATCLCRQMFLCSVCQASGKPVVAFNLFASWDRSMTMHMRFYSLFDSAQAVGSMTPNIVLVVPFRPADGQEFTLWDPCRPRRRQAPRPQPPAQPEDAAAIADGDLDSVAPDGEESDESVPEPADESDEEEEGVDAAAMLAAEIDDALAEIMEEGAPEEAAPPVNASSSGMDVPEPAAQSSPTGSDAIGMAVAMHPAAHSGDGGARANHPRAAIAEVRGSGLRLPAEVVLPVATGTITFYETIGDFVAKCSFPGHGNLCRLTRRAIPVRPTTTGSGRALGLMTAFLLEEGHRTPAGRARMSEFAQRRAGRTFLKEVPNSDLLFARERPRRDDEPDSEPEACP